MKDRDTVEASAVGCGERSYPSERPTSPDCVFRDRRAAGRRSRYQGFGAQEVDTDHDVESLGRGGHRTKDGFVDAFVFRGKVETTRDVGTSLIFGAKIAYDRAWGW